MASGVHVDHISSQPHVWVVDGAVSESFLSLVDDKLTTSEGTVKSELRNGKSITSRSVEFQVDDTSRHLFETVAGFWGLNPEQPCESFVVSDICGEGQSPHVDHINLDDLAGCELDFLDLGRQSASAVNPRRVVPTISVVVYFNSVGGIRFPHADELGTIAAKRGRIVMFQNYIDDQRPCHDSLAAHHGLYLDSLPKRILVMGILANETPSFFPNGPAAASPTRSLIYCPGTEQDPLRHDAPSYDYLRSPKERAEVEEARYEEARREHDRERERYEAEKRRKEAAKKAKKTDLILSLEAQMSNPETYTFTVACRSLAGRELLSVSGDGSANLTWLRAEIKKALDPEDVHNVVLCVGTERIPEGDGDMPLSQLVPLSIDEVKLAFKKADANKDGFLDKAEAKAMFHSLAEVLPNIMTDAEIDQLFEAVDADADGRLNMSEFIDWCFGVHMIEKRDHDALKAQHLKG
ncbi:unnamed protein product [Symbiodinium natans]|uniref:EF-hand domain-containing protein n=1 Tax=Symbiodinium natans TaxID=878477 RepID=A0A812PJA5_9DINO|nr:unnamed protein product [Symbiodinium natans]